MAPKRPKRSKRRLQQQAAAAVKSNHPLPTCEGPKLGKFEHHRSAIRFVKLLSAETPGEDGHVFEVIIKSEHYALKMASDVPARIYSMISRLMLHSLTGSLPFSILQMMSAT